ncbi:lipoate--protein ligase family protein [Limnoglobus roseus]|uniref:Lipoate--protein ligase family protein n=1 Tax=Limnoglobus roseus TaxID=2598579 RepID=A0A5C1A6X5_9BACT|nr:biotin/lipoate A/B protein ligase family protein [Limnoglobus roseus]QEL15009.1 lipoate--protein ligase family protein [Limnoglobus roseus]
MTLTLRRLPLVTAAGPDQMALDEAMLESAADRNVASFRFYRWSEPTLSLGYFQPAEVRLPGLAWVRRASGGAAILHHHPHELTYSFALPASAVGPLRGENWICRVHHLLRDFLHTRGIPAHAVVCGEEKKLGDGLCFLHHTPGDLVIGGSKVVGSAQRKLRGALLQHGTILLSQSPLTPQLPGIAELAKPVPADEVMPGFANAMQSGLGWNWTEGQWTEEERAAASRIAAEKYRSAEWNHRR